MVVAAAGGGAVEVLELQPAGKRRMAAAEFLRGRKLQPGERFGPETA
jgi:methionyl-tRNA formyltransferase